MGYRDSPASARQVAAELGVSYLTEGTIQRAGDQLRVTIRLIDPSTDNPVWSSQYDRLFTLDSYFDIQSEIAATIASSLATEMSPEEGQRVADRPTANLEAWDAYQRGNAHFANWFFADRREAASDAYREAIALDSMFADAYSRLARTLVLDFWWSAEPETAEEAWEALRHAEAIDSTRAEVHLAHGDLSYLTMRDYAEAERHFQRALELRPSDAATISRLGQLGARQGRDVSNEQMDLAFELDPRSDATAFQRALQKMLLHDGPEALRWLDIALALNPQPDVYRWHKVQAALCVSGDTALARQFVDEPGWQNERTRALTRAWVDAFREGTPFPDEVWLDLSPDDWREYWQRRRLVADRSPAGAAFRDSVYELLPNTMEVQRQLSAGYLAQQPGVAFSVRGLIDAVEGRDESARRWALAGLEAMAGHVDVGERAWRGEDLLSTYLVLGDHDGALKELEHQLNAVSDVGPGCAQLDPRFDPLRGTPEFERILAQALPESP